MAQLRLLAFPSNRPGILADQEIQVGTPVGLKDMIDVEPGVAAVATGKLRLPILSALRESPFRNLQVKQPAVRVQFDDVARGRQRQRAARLEFG